MAENSKIEWTHHTFNPWIGCQKVSGACDNCYAMAWDHRFGGERWGAHANRTRTSPANWNKPRRWARDCASRGVRERVFCASLADVFDNHRSIPRGWREDLWELIYETPELDWLLLTKRPQNIAKMLPLIWGNGFPNVWLGTTVENQEEANRRIPHLLSVPAVVHYLSCEPLLGEVRLDRLFRVGQSMTYVDNALTGFISNGYGGSYDKRIDWVITGGESGPNFRRANPDWFRSLRDQCAASDTAFLLKQWEGRNQKIIKALGRELDGVIHDGYPEPSRA